MRIWLFVIVSSLNVSAVALAQDVRGIADWPDGIPTNSVQYTGFLDWVAKRKFTADGVPVEITNAYWQCVYPAIYNLMESDERDRIDKVARGYFLTSDAKATFFEGVRERVGGSGKFWATLLKGCKAEFRDYWNFLKNKNG